MADYLVSNLRFQECNSSRIHKEKDHDYRGAFQRDRDRLLHSVEFRRLSGKTQVFVAGFDDNMRTRLTHTLEVAQIADTLIRTLGLNDMLAQAISYGHDVGHTPFGHVGERTLNHIMNGCEEFSAFNKNLSPEQKGFKHNLQSVLVVTRLEHINKNYLGLNLTKQTLWGIKNHTKCKYNDCEYYIKSRDICGIRYRNDECRFKGSLCLDYYNQVAAQIVDKEDWSFEGVFVSLADEIAQRHHDIEDGLYAGIIVAENMIDVFKKAFEKDKLLSASDITRLKIACDDYKYKKRVTIITKEIVNIYCTIVLEKAVEKLKEIEKKYGIDNSQGFYEAREEIYKYLFLDNKWNELLLGKEFVAADKKFRGYLSNIILKSELAQKMDGKASYVIRRIFRAYLSNPQQLPDNTMIRILQDYSPNSIAPNSRKERALQVSFARHKINEALKTDPKKIDAIILRKICDHIAGMTDSYAIAQFRKLYGADEFRNY